MNPERIQNKNAMTKKKFQIKNIKKMFRTISCVDNLTLVRAIVIGKAYCQKLKIRSDMIRNYKKKNFKQKF